MTAPAFWLALLAGMAIGILGQHFVKRSVLFACWWYGLWTVFDTVISALSAAVREWGWCALLAGFAVFNGVQWWKYWNRRKRKRAAALAGAKSRARVAALVRKAREAGTPRRVLRPVPGKSV